MTDSSVAKKTVGRKLTAKEMGRLNEAALSVARLWELFIPDFEAGELTYRISIANQVKAGRIAGSLSSTAHLVIEINGKAYKLHRIIWAMFHGEWPSDEIDHINGDRSDNRITNLRDVSRTENCRNQKKQSNNTSGVTGVYYDKESQKWTAKIRIDGKLINKGRFDTFEEAGAARKAAEIEYGFHPNHGRGEPPDQQNLKKRPKNPSQQPTKTNLKL